MAVRLHVWGKLACFARPEIRRKRVSYDVMTPAAAREILTSIHWKPAIRWLIDKIHILRPIRFDSVLWGDADINQANKPVGRSVEAWAEKEPGAIVLVDVAYVIEAHFVLTERAGPRDNAAKHLDMFNRKASRGRSFRPPFFGLRRFPASFHLLEKGASLPVSTFPSDPDRVDLGWMLHDFDYESGKIARFFRAQIVDGTISVPPPDSPDLMD